VSYHWLFELLDMAAGGGGSGSGCRAHRGEHRERLVQRAVCAALLQQPSMLLRHPALRKAVVTRD